MLIGFNKPSVEGRELEYVRESIANCHISGDGAFTKRANAMLESILGATKVLLTTSCTHALEMAAILLDFKEGDEVIVPSFTFVSGVNAFVLRGAKPVFADIRPDTLNIDEQQIGSLITPRTRAIAPVHYAGVGCEMDAIVDIARRHRLEIVEDNAHGLFGRYRGRLLGTFGRMATQSFHETKNINCGEGGALVINDPSLIERAEIVREKGTNRSRFFRGQVDKYTWVDLGSSYLPSDMLAAYLVGQFEMAEVIQGKRQRVWERYDEALAGWAAANGIGRPAVPEHCEQPFHMYYLLFRNLEERQSMIAHLRRREIVAVFHYLPLNTSEMGARFGGRAGQCTVAESVSDRLLRLPFYNNLTAEEQDQVIEAIHSWRR
ncbi:MAG: dTDP-4-amino-4,6-dideoxygalactose transaminase [Thermoanaerobaculia bacterium]|jgi:dTDP-4-amino-4,6-dideoxygalactose transaminase|nr:dTDP-4-amino-4,6-dideoxygalactose transaminase [Thermoanaerobaculia bacterium]